MAIFGTWDRNMGNTSGPTGSRFSQIGLDPMTSGNLAPPAVLANVLLGKKPPGLPWKSPG